MRILWTLVVALLFASTSCKTETGLTPPSSLEDRSGMDGNWVGFTNSMDCYPYQGWYFWLKKDNRKGREKLWEIYWWNRPMWRGEKLIQTDVIDTDGQRIMLAQSWQLVRTNQ